MLLFIQGENKFASQENFKAFAKCLSDFTQVLHLLHRQDRPTVGDWLVFIVAAKTSTETKYNHSADRWCPSWTWQWVKTFGTSMNFPKNLLNELGKTIYHRRVLSSPRRNNHRWFWSQGSTGCRESAWGPCRQQSFRRHNFAFWNLSPLSTQFLIGSLWDRNGAWSCDWWGANIYIDISFLCFVVS